MFDQSQKSKHRMFVVRMFLILGCYILREPKVETRTIPDTPKVGAEIIIGG